MYRSIFPLTVFASLEKQLQIERKSHVWAHCASDMCVCVCLGVQNLGSSWLVFYKQHRFTSRPQSGGKTLLTANTTPFVYLWWLGVRGGISWTNTNHEEKEGRIDKVQGRVRKRFGVSRLWATELKWPLHPWHYSQFREHTHIDKTNTAFVELLTFHCNRNKEIQNRPEK